MRAGRRRGDQRLSGQTSRGIDPGESPHRSGLCISFDTNQLPGKEYRSTRLQLQGVSQQLRRIDEGVAMQTAEP